MVARRASPWPGFPALFSFVFAFCAVAPAAFSQSLPAFNWVQEVDGSGLDSFAGLGTDAQGNTYIAGSTRSAKFPVKSAAQNNSAYIDGFDCDGVAAVMGPADGFPGAVYRLTVYVPNPAALAASNPYLLNFTFHRRLASS